MFFLWYKVYYVFGKALTSITLSLHFLKVISDKYITVHNKQSLLLNLLCVRG